MFRVTNKRIDVTDVIREVEDPREGAIVTFLGVVRGNSEGRRVSYLEYEAFDEMAEKKMAEIASEILDRWGIDRVAMIHRVGHLEVGEASIAIAVASPHRKEGFAACEYAIDRVKETLPVWKKEVWEDGEAWVEGKRPSA